MTDEVGRLVLEDNIDQNILLLNDRQRVAEWSPSYERLMDWLEKSADLKRDLEALPTTDALRERLEQGQGLTSPELSVLAAYAKIELATALRDSDLADDPWFRGTLRRLLPGAAAGKVRRRTGHPPAAPGNHRNRRGQRHDQPGRHHLRVPRPWRKPRPREAAVAKAFVALREVYELDIMVERTQRAAGVVPDRTLEHRPPGHPAAAGPCGPMGPRPGQRVPADRRHRRRVQAAHGSHAGPAAGLPARRRPRARGRLAGEGARLGPAGGPGATAGPSCSRASCCWTSPRSRTPARSPVEDIAHVYYTVFNRFHADSLLERITKLPRKDRWQALARAALRDDLYSTVSDMTTAVLESTPAGSAGRGAAGGLGAARTRSSWAGRRACLTRSMPSKRTTWPRCR